MGRRCLGPLGLAWSRSAVSRLRFSCQIIKVWYISGSWSLSWLNTVLSRSPSIFKGLKLKRDTNTEKWKTSIMKLMKGGGHLVERGLGRGGPAKACWPGSKTWIWGGGVFFPLCTPSLSGTFIYFVRRWGLAKNCSLFSPVLFYMKLLKVRAKGMEAIKLRIQEVCLKRPDIFFEEKICFQDILAAKKK